MNTINQYADEFLLEEVEKEKMSHEKTRFIREHEIEEVEEEEL